MKSLYNINGKVKNKVQEKVKLILKRETGEVSLLVFITIITFVIILAGVYFTTTTMTKTRLRK